MPLNAELIRSFGNTIMVLFKCVIAVVTEAKMSLHPLGEHAPLLQLRPHLR